MANCGWMVRDSTMVTIESVWETTIALSSGTINDPYDLPFPQNGAQNAHLVMCRISNGEISATGHPYHFVFCSRVGFSGSADRMTLFPVLSNPRWRPWHDMTWQKISTRAGRCRLCQIALALDEVFIDILYVKELFWCTCCFCQRALHHSDMQFLFITP